MSGRLGRLGRFGRFGRFGRSSRNRYAQPPRHVLLPIGELDANIINCPTCARPLDVGARRCPGCGTRLIGGVRAKRAVGFVALGVFGGLLVAGAVMLAMAGLGRLTQAAAVVAVPPVTAPSAAPVASVPIPVVDPAIPSSALSGLRQSTLLNQRIVAQTDQLSAALAAKNPSPTQIAPILRTMAATASFGDGIASEVGTWEAGAPLAQDLATFYAAISGVAQDGLTASMGNSKAYVTAGKRMLRIMDGITDLDAAARVLALTAELELPPLVAAEAVAP